MKFKHLFLIIGCLLLATVFNLNICFADAVDDANSVIDGIVMFKMQESGASDIEDWIGKDLVPNAGITAETYAYSLAKKGGYDLSAYAASLSRFLDKNEIRAASTRLKYALCLAATDPKNSYITETVNEAVGAQGIMSLVYGLHLANNGYLGGGWTKEGILAEILQQRHEDGGWSVMGEYSDVDVTAMVLQAFAGYEPQTDVSEAIDTALTFLSAKQHEDGGFASFGSDNAESTAQALLALSSLGIDANGDERFIKNGKTVFDGIAMYRLSDGIYAHVAGGSSNATATMQVFSAMDAYVCMKDGKLPYYLINGQNKEGQEPTETPKPTEKQEQNATPAVTGNPGKDNGNTPAGNKADYKKVAYAAIAALAVIACAVLFIIKKRNYKNFIFVALLAILAVLAVRFTNFASKDSYYGGQQDDTGKTIGTATILIRCDTIKDIAKNEFVPKDGQILAETEYSIYEGESVYDLLVRAVRENSIHMENRKTAIGAHGAYYISGINHIYEYEYGELSGWMYYVNGEAPSVGCGEYILKPGDRVEWLYTREIGKDIK